MAGDTRLFKVTFSTGRVRYGTRRGMGAVLAAGVLGKRLGDVEKVEVVPGDLPWADVTAEFFPEVLQTDRFPKQSLMSQGLAGELVDRERVRRRNGL